MSLNLRIRLITWIRRIFLTLATFFWMGLIFGFSSDTAEESAGLSAVICRFLAERFVKGFESLSSLEQERITESLQLYVRKGAHVTEYMILGVLLFLTLGAYGLRRVFSLALLTGVLYAALDEYHQRFVPGRSGEIKDVLIDACGLLLGLVLTQGAGRLMQMIKGKRKTERQDGQAGPEYT